MRYLNGKNLIFAVFILSLTFSNPQAFSQQENCSAPKQWFPHNQTPRPNDEANFDSNCKFHQWSYQMFLWLTQKMDDGQLRFEHMARPSDLFKPDASDPGPYSNRTSNQVLQLSPRTKKIDEIPSFSEIKQAGSLGLLVDQNGRAVYYSMYVNEEFYDFVRKNKYYDPSVYKNAPATKNFPISALELKASWKIVEPGETAAGFYTRKANINLLANQNGELVVSDKTDEVTVALVGFHIAGVVKDHPEFIWATFEHEDNAPTLSQGMLSLSQNINYNDSAVKEYFESTVISGKNWTFYKAGTPYGECNVNNAPVIKLVNAEKQILSPITQAFTRYELGVGFPLNSDDVTNLKNIQQLNESVQQQLDSGSIWKNYRMVGAIWLAANNGLAPRSDLQDLITGSRRLSNVNMETFTQKVSNQNNCFSCHNTMNRYFPETAKNNPNDVQGAIILPGKNMNVSHILVNHYFESMQKKTQ